MPTEDELDRMSSAELDAEFLKECRELTTPYLLRMLTTSADVLLEGNAPDLVPGQLVKIEGASLSGRDVTVIVAAGPIREPLRVAYEALKRVIGATDARPDEPPQGRN